MPPAFPSLNALEPVLITPYSVTSGEQTIDPWAIDVAIVVPPGTVAAIQTAEAVSFTTDRDVSLNSNGRPMANTFVVSRSSGSGTIQVFVSRVAGKEATNA